MTCPRYLTGFRSQAERDGHSLIHKTSFTCRAPNCRHSCRNFSTKDELDGHVKTHEVDSITEDIKNLKPFRDVQFANVGNENVRIMIQDVIHESNIRRIEFLIQKYDDVSEVDILHQAAEQGSLNVIKHMLDSEVVHVDATRNATRTGGWEPVIALSVAGTVDAVQLLLDYNADPKLLLGGGAERRTPFTQIIRTRPFNEDKVAAIMDHNKLDLPELLHLNSVLDQKIKMEGGWVTTPWQAAVKRGCATRLLSMTMERGLYLNEKIALQLLLSSSQIEPELLPHLLRCVVELPVKALERATEARDPVRMDFILKHGEIDNQRMENALSEACLMAFEGGVRLLLDHNVDPNAPHRDPKYKRSPLLSAMKNCSLYAAHIIKLLVEAGAETRRRQGSRKIPEDYQVTQRLKDYIGVTWWELLVAMAEIRKQINGKTKS